jgi:hypothetical protein
MSKFIKVTRSDLPGSYTQRWAEIASAIAAELEDANEYEPGTVISLEVIEMDEEEYEKLPEFQGW